MFFQLLLAALPRCLPAPSTTPFHLITPEEKAREFPSLDVSVQFQYFGPATPASGSHLPVLVFLHGRGESGGTAVTNAQSLPLRLLRPEYAANFPAIVIAPICPESCMEKNKWPAPVLRQAL